MNLEPGTKLGKYEIVRRIAVGGMAELYLARTTAIGGFEKLVVLKRILPQHADDPAFIDMFLDEARLAATLHHHNIAQVYDIGVDEGAYFFAMEYVHGADIKSIMMFADSQNTRIPLECVVTIAIGALNGLHYAHEKVNQAGELLNLVHRDVSPQNLLVSYDGSVKLVDFGIAKAKSSNKQTGTGSLKGKISYMSPEQCLTSAALDRRSDIFSVGTLVWELTTGRRLFEHESEYVQIRKIVEEDAASPRTIVPDYPPALEAIVMKALRRERDARYATAAEMQDEFEDFAHDNRLRVSSKTLAKYMESLFGKKLDEWNTARDKGAFFVEEHVVKTLAGQRRVLESVVTEEETTVRAQVPPNPETTPDTQVTAAVPMPDAITQLTTPPEPPAAGKSKPLHFDDIKTDIVKPTPLPFTAPTPRLAPPVSAVPQPLDRAATEATVRPSANRSKRGVLYVVAALALAGAAIAIVTFTGGSDDDDSSAAPAVESEAEPAAAGLVDTEPAEPPEAEPAAGEPEPDQPEDTAAQIDEPKPEPVAAEPEPVAAEPEPVANSKPDDGSETRKRHKKSHRSRTQKRAKHRSAKKKSKKKGKKWSSKSMFLPD